MYVKWEEVYSIFESAVWLQSVVAIRSLGTLWLPCVTHGSSMIPSLLPSICLLLLLLFPNCTFPRPAASLSHSLGLWSLFLLVSLSCSLSFTNFIFCLCYYSLSLSPSVNCFHWIPNTICPFLSISLAYIPITYYNYNDTSRVQTFAGAFNYISDVPISQVRKSFFTMSFMLWYGIMMVESFVFPDYFDSTLMQQKCAYAQC